MGLRRKENRVPGRGNLEGNQKFRSESIQDLANHIKEFEVSHLDYGEPFSPYRQLRDRVKHII